MVAAAREKPGNRVNYTFDSHAGVAELADAQDLKSCDAKASCGFDPRPRQSLTTISSFGSIGHFWPIAPPSSAVPIRPQFDVLFGRLDGVWANDPRVNINVVFRLFR